MKNYFFIYLLIATCLSNAFSNDLTIQADCEMTFANNQAKVTYYPETVSSTGANSHYFGINFNSDENSGILLSLNPTSKICKDTDCEEHIGTTYTLSLVRVANSLAAKMQLSEAKSVKGKTASTVQLTVYDDGKFESAYIDEDGEVKYGQTNMPASMSLDYEVKNGLLKKSDKIKMDCKLSK